MHVIEGRPFVDGRDEIMTDTAWLEQPKMKIGDKFKIYERDFEIVGTYEPSVGSRIKIPLATMQAQLGPRAERRRFSSRSKKVTTPQAVGETLASNFRIIRSS